MAESLGTAVLDLRADGATLKRDMDQAERDTRRSLDSIGKRSEAWGKNLTKRVTLPIIALGTAAFASFAQVEKGQNAVTLATGATGKELEGLHKSYRDALGEGRKFGLTHEQIGQVVGDLNTHFGLQGEALTEAAGRMAAFSRATGVDGAEAVGRVNRVMQDWGIETEQMPGLLDKLTVAGQKTGVGVDALMQDVVKFGVPMRNFGFDIDESIALLSSFEQQGVNSELVMGSLRIATGKFAREGKDLKTGLWETIEAIQGAETSSEAAAIGMEVFGARAGSDMAKAIQEGRFEIDDLVAALGDSEGATQEVADNTVTAADRMRESWAEVQAAIMPVGAAISGVLAGALQRITPIISAVASAFGSMPGPVKASMLGFLAAAAALGPLLVVGGKTITMIANTRAGTNALGIALKFLAANPIVLIIAALVALAAGLVYAYRNSETFRDIVHAALQKVGAAGTWLWNSAIKPAWDAIQAATAALWGHIQTAGRGIQQAFTAVGSAGSWLWNNAIRPAWDGITAGTSALWSSIRTAGSGIESAVRSVGAAASWLWANAIRPAWEGITTGTSALRTALTTFGGWWVGVFQEWGRWATWLWQNAIRPAFSGIGTVVSTFWDGAKGTFDLARGALGKIGTAAGDMKDAIKTAFDFIRDKIVDPSVRTFKRIANGFIAVVNKVIDGANAIAGAISKIPGVEISIGIAKIAPLELADGEIIRRPTLAVVGEDGPEAVIPLGGKRRRRGQELMTRAAMMMGMPGVDPSSGLKFMAEGGIVAPGPSVADLQANIASYARGDGGSGNLFSKAFDVMKDGLGAFLVNIPKLSLGDGPWAEAMSGFPGWVWDKVKGMATSLFRSAERAFGTLDIMRTKHLSDSIMGRPYGWGAGRPPGWNHASYDCSGSASTAWWEASGKRGGSGTTMSLFPISKRARGDEPFQFVFRGMSSSDPRQQHMGWKILGDTYDFGNPGMKNRPRGWDHAMVPPYVPGFAEGTDRITREGLAYLHRDEEVVPANERGRRGRVFGKLAEHVHFHDAADAPRVIGDLGNRLAMRIGATG